MKLAVAALTPILVVAAGFWLNRRLKSVEQAQWSHQKVIERRIKAYDELAKSLNELLCFFCYVGGWKEWDPPDLIKLKRTLDQIAYTNAPLFDQEFVNRYRGLMDICFKTFGRWGDDAKLRTLIDRRKSQRGETWDPQWDALFVSDPENEASDPKQVEKKYVYLTEYLAAAIGVQEVNAHLQTQLPGNYQMGDAGRVSINRPLGDLPGGP
ncbi:MAG TPA: hypothetical protein VHS74_07170 [Solirubrobacterales bacterium]|nr:hypothetical protein [Solirubrobacterales bacterium]